MPARKLITSSTSDRIAARLRDHLKLILAVVVVLVIAGSFYADYKWRKWMAARRRERE